MKKEVVTYICDNCSGPGVPEELDIPDPLPEGWMDVQASTNHALIFKQQLCVDCMLAVAQALRSREG
jgi:hypothetical protein